MHTRVIGACLTAVDQLNKSLEGCVGELSCVSTAKTALHALDACCELTGCACLASIGTCVKGHVHWANGAVFKLSGTALRDKKTLAIEREGYLTQ